MLALGLVYVMLGNETESTISIDAENFRLNGFLLGGNGREASALQPKIELSRINYGHEMNGK